MRIDDVSPRRAATTITLSKLSQSVSGKALCVACSTDGTRAYIGGHSGVWRSDDGGQTWWQPVRPQPPSGTTNVAGALWVPNVYDLLVSPFDADVVFAATGNDARRPARHGVYRSTDGARSWELVYQPPTGTTSRGVGCLAIAPDDPQRIYAAAERSLGVSTDGGIVWNDIGANPGAWVRHIVVGPQEGAGSSRRLYAVGTSLWYSNDDGATWRRDPGGRSLGFPADGLGTSSRALSIHPTDPRIIYIAIQGTYWRGDFTDFDANGAAVWSMLPAVPVGYPGTTASGTDYVLAHADPSGEIYLVVSDRRSVHIAPADPTAMSDWVRVDGGDVHVDPHGLALTPEFRFATPGGPDPTGRMYMVNDGGVCWSDDGAQTWNFVEGLSTLGLVNAAALPVPGGAAGLCMGCGDNSGFFSGDGGATWKTQHYLGGDNDCCFADPRQPSRLIVFAPRTGLSGLFLYRVAEGSIPDGAVGTSDAIEIPGPPAPPMGPRWNSTSGFFNLGNRPVVLTLATESARPDGDFLTIRYTGTQAMLLRTTAISDITDATDWVTTATSDGPGVKAYRVGPVLPDIAIDVVQASGGHTNTVFYVGDPDVSQRIWRWSQGGASWQQLVPNPAVVPGPDAAARFFVDPYRPGTLYVLDDDHVWRSDDDGTTWTVDASLEDVLTEGGEFPFDVPYDGNPGEALVRDILFDPQRPGYRFAIGPAGVFYTLDGVNWDHLLRTSAMPMRPNNGFYDTVSDPCGRTLYVATNNRGLLALSPLPPEWDFPLGAIVASEGRLMMLRVHDVGTGYGPPQDQLDAEVVVTLDSQPGKAFGFQLRTDDRRAAHQGMLELLRDAFNQNARVRIEFRRSGCRTAEIIRVLRL